VRELTDVRYEVAGQTALTGDSISSIFADLGRIALAIMLVPLVVVQGVTVRGDGVVVRPRVSIARMA